MQAHCRLRWPRHIESRKEDETFTSAELAYQQHVEAQARALAARNARSRCRFLDRRDSTRALQAERHVASFGQALPWFCPSPKLVLPTGQGRAHPMRATWRSAWSAGGVSLLSKTKRLECAFLAASPPGLSSHPDLPVLDVASRRCNGSRLPSLVGEVPLMLWSKTLRAETPLCSSPGGRSERRGQSERGANLDIT